MRYAAYLRISSEDQRGNFSIDAQRRAVEAAMRRGWLVIDGKKEKLNGLTSAHLDRMLAGLAAGRADEGHG